jgi:hypothetical protein
MPAPLRIPLADHVHSRITFEPNLGCWLWLGAMTGNGYGKVWDAAAGVTEYAHRVIYRDRIGPIPAGYDVCHRCDVRLCVNPAHLFVGTRADNLRDMKEKGRARGARGEKHYCARLTALDVRRLRALRAAGALHRELWALYPGISHGAVSHAVAGLTWKHLSSKEQSNG